ncbi:nicotinate-nucleotide--dimethylbenzimidazole phosphoribosyltransferase [Chryseolinea lacunae]|uniref:Nicotinate-nucleotide--dimethylbenzimidazole phosphoribosyltransferase n=1 Tax=Chryseolinea lacunae TaxID=2801331 RepID=A0ABS1KP66_9BACT|nr:nicotinate-nucleotide--dimethylbenzimidazole phosphoribosyltransferase [Chryseolinea lacunae]MBL0741013.1 nicotinate-nucleotide--dimethylbenzimidazole phosphoribosyltransferase [Chryseolinea lacunae]
MKSFRIQPPDQSLRAALQTKIDNKTKPLGALGRLEALALQIGLIQGTSTPTLHAPHMLIFAGDHGIAAEGVSAYPQEVTWQMVMNFLQGGAAINVFSKQHQLQLYVVDAGVNYDFPENLPGLLSHKIAKGTQNFLHEQAMKIEAAQRCIDQGAEVVTSIFNKGCNVVGFGEMGIGNTSSASMLMSGLLNIPIDQCTGRGTGLDDERLHHKIDILTKAQQRHGALASPLELLATFGGFEIAQMVGAMLQAAEHKMIILVDGFIVSAAFLVAHAIDPNLKSYGVFCHRSQEQGHAHMMRALDVQPLLDLGMRLGEGTGAAMAYPLLASAVAFLNEMASFESAHVSEKNS